MLVEDVSTRQWLRVVGLPLGLAMLRLGNQHLSRQLPCVRLEDVAAVAWPEGRARPLPSLYCSGRSPAPVHYSLDT